MINGILGSIINNAITIVRVPFGNIVSSIVAPYTTTVTVGKATSYASANWGYSPRSLTHGSVSPTQVVFNGEDTLHPYITYITSPYGSPTFTIKYDSGGVSPFTVADFWPQDWIDGITMDGVVYSQSDANYGFFAGSTGSEVYHKWTSPAAAPFVDADIANDFVVTWNAGS